MKTPVSKERFRNHLTYSSWKYLLLIVLAIFGWNIAYTTTRYRPPEEKKVNVHMYVSGDYEKLDAYMKKVQAEQMPDMEEMEASFQVLDQTYGAMLMTTYIAAGEGDIYILNTEYFQNYASGSMFVRLDEYPELVARLEEGGAKLNRGWRTETETGEKHLYGIQCSQLPGMSEYLLNPEESYLVVIVTNANEENVMKFLDILVTDTLVQPAEAAAQ